MAAAAAVTPAAAAVPAEAAALLPVKPVRLLVLVLTSGDVALLRRAVSSVTEWQLPEPRLAVSVRIVVNSLKPGYAEEVRAAYPAGDVVVTESNGRPGKGHNSQLAEFRRSRADFDYACFLDGDDAYYPPALQLLFRLFDSGVQVGGIMCNDKVMGPWDPDFEGAQPLEARFGMRTFGDVETHWWRQAPRLDPFKHPVYKVSTPLRLLFLSAKALDLPVSIRYCERAELFDDFLAYLHVMEIWRRGLADVRFLSNTYLYCYTTLNESNATHAYVRANKQESEERTFREALAAEAGYFDALRAAWAADPLLTARTPFFHIGKPTGYTLENKREFAVARFVVPCINTWFAEANAAFVGGRFVDALPMYEKLRQTGLQLETTALNAGVCYFHLGRLAEALHCWLDVPPHKRNANLHKNLGVLMTQMATAGPLYAEHYLQLSLQQEPAQPGITAELERVKKARLAAAAHNK